MMLFVNEFSKIYEVKAEYRTVFTHYATTINSTNANKGN